MTRPLVLSDDEVTQFKEHGYVHVSEAFPREAALAMQDFMWAQLFERNGIDRHDHTTWSRQWGGLNRCAKHPIYRHIAGERMRGAISQLLGWGHGKSRRTGVVFLSPFRQKHRRRGI